MGEYDKTRDAARVVIEKYEGVLRRLQDDYEHEIVVAVLVRYHDLVSKPDKIDNSDMVIEPDEDLLWAIERVLEDFMTPAQFYDWRTSIRESANLPY